MSLTRARSLQALMELDFDEADALARLGLIDQAIERHRREIGQEPAWGWFVPGRIEIFGKHTDYAGGRSLLSAVPRGFAVAASPRSDGLVRVRNASGGEAGVIDSTRPAAEYSGWLNYVGVVVRRLTLNFPGSSLGADLTLASDLPRAAGLSSSSALVVSVATALIRRGDLEARPEWAGAIRTRYDLAGYLGAMEMGGAFGPLTGMSGVGTFGGSEDHTAILTCVSGKVSACRYVPIRPLGDAPMPDDWRFVIAATGVQAEKTGGARDQYNRASLATRALMRLWNERTGQSQPTLAAVLASDTSAADDLHAIAASSDDSEFAPEVLTRRLAHFIAEDGRVPEALRAFREADSPALGVLSRDSQSDAERLLQNQTEETRTLARLAWDHGAFAASSFGAGFGGSVWALAPANEAVAFGERWTADYLRRYPHLSRVEWFVARPAPSLFEYPAT